MKSKPKNLDEFMSAGDTAAAESKPTPPPATAPAETRITKTIRISPALNQRLKREAFEREQATGQRVSESDVIEAALRNYLSI